MASAGTSATLPADTNDVQGKLAEPGTANFSTSGENTQDNDLIVIRDADAATKFEAHFERMWGAAAPVASSGDALSRLAATLDRSLTPAIRAMEPR